jgi:hypothetical protein
MAEIVTVGEARFITDSPGGRDSKLWGCILTEDGESLDVAVEITNSVALRTGITTEEVVLWRVATEYEMLPDGKRNLSDIAAMLTLPLNTIHATHWLDVAPDHRCPECGEDVPFPTVVSAFRQSALGSVRFMYRTDCPGCVTELERDIQPGSTWQTRVVP